MMRIRDSTPSCGLSTKELQPPFESIVITLRFFFLSFLSVGKCNLRKWRQHGGRKDDNPDLAIVEPQLMHQVFSWERMG